MHRPRRSDATRIVLIASYVVMAGAPAFAVGPDAGPLEDPNRIHVTDIGGDVDVTMAGERHDVGVGATVLLPAVVETGSDGRLGLRQSATSISVAPDSKIEIPQAASGGQLVARLVQWRGNVFYDVETREVNKLRVETPYLVAVVKGTQFNVAVLGDTTTISLFEGRLEIRMPDDSQVVEIEPGEIAIRSSTDDSIRVLNLNADRLPAVDGNLAERRLAAQAADATRGVADEIARVTRADYRAEDLRVAPAIDLGAAAATETTVRLDPAADLSLGTNIDLGLGSGDTRLDLGAELGAPAADVGVDAGFDLAGGTLDAGVDAGLDLGAASADLGVDTSLDLGAGSLDAGLDAGLDLGAATADVGVDAGLDLGGGTLDLGLDADADVGDVGLDTGLDTGVDLAGGSVDVGLDAALDAGDTSLDAGLDAGLDLADGSLDAGLDVGLGDTLDTDLDASIDLAGADAGAELTVPLGSDEVTLDADLAGDGGLLDVVDGGDDGGLGGLLNGLL